MEQMPDHAQGHHPPPPGRGADPPGRHGMAVIGELAVYLSHLPMFMFPHDYQVLLEVEFDGPGDPQQAYFDDRQNHPDQRLYTFDPEPFVLPAIFAAEGSPASVTSVRGTLHRGHFERNTTPAPVAVDVTARIKNVIHQHRFEPGAADLPELRYLLFGRGAETFLAHVVTGPPSFDQLLSVEVDTRLPDRDLAGGIVVKVGGRPDTVEGRIDPGAGGQVAATAEIGGRAQPVGLRPRIEFYLETGELAAAH